LFAHIYTERHRIARHTGTRRKLETECEREEENSMTEPEEDEQKQNENDMKNECEESNNEAR
jgi:hypothetical protein